MGGRRTPFSAGTTTPIYETQASHVVYPGTHTYICTHTHTPVLVCACVAVRSAGQSSSMTRATSMISTENFPPQKWQNSPFVPPAGYPEPERAVALINGLSMYIFRRSHPSPIIPSRTLRQIYETESTNCARSKIFTIIDRRQPSFMTG